MFPMPLHPPTQTAFLHIPKCGGTSVEHTLCQPKPRTLQSIHWYVHNKRTSWFVQWSLWAYATWGDTWRAACTIVMEKVFWLSQWWWNDDPYQCVPYRSLLTHTPLCERPGYPSILHHYRWFTIVRNPYTRLISAYHQLHYNSDSQSHPYPFEQFCQDARDQCNTHIDPQGRFRFHRGANVFLLPQYVFVCDANATRCVVDRVIRFETLNTANDEWSRLRCEWGLEAHWPERLPHTNRSSVETEETTSSESITDSTTTTACRPQWTPALAEMVYETYRVDFEWFGYSKESYV